LARDGGLISIISSIASKEWELVAGAHFHRNLDYFNQFMLRGAMRQRRLCVVVSAISGMGRRAMGNDTVSSLPVQRHLKKSQIERFGDALGALRNDHAA
jgi:hypothetical protein